MAGFMGMISRQLMLLILILAGTGFTKLGYVGDKARKFMSELIMRVLMPCTVVSVLMEETVNPEKIKSFFLVMGIGFVIEAICYFATIPLFSKCPADENTVLRYGLISPNSTFIGIPIIEGFYGAAGVFYLSALFIPINIFMYLFGLRLFLPPGQRKDKRALVKQIFHPAVVGVVVGFVLMISGIQLPTFMGDALKSLGSCTTPLSMVLIGSILATVRPSTILSKSNAYFCALRLVAMPLLTLGLVLLTGSPAVAAGTIVLVNGMPAAVGTAALATSYNGNSVFASKIIFLSTILSMLTLPLLAILTSSVLPP